MNKAIAILIVVLIIISGVWFTVRSEQKNGKNQPVEVQKKDEIKNMNFFSPAFKTSESIPEKYTCKGENISPELVIQDTNPLAKSLAIIVDDPDATNGDWMHLIMWNIDPKTQSIPENSIPKGATVGKNDFGQNNYGGPCPPSGVHRYFFKLYALDSKLELTSFSSKSDLEKAMQGHIIEMKDFFGIFNK